MALQDIITNLGTAIINLVNVRITKAFTTHDSELEEILLDLKAKVDELAGDNTPDIPVTPTTEEFDINCYTGWWVGPSSPTVIESWVKTYITGKFIIALILIAGFK